MKEIEQPHFAVAYMFCIRARVMVAILRQLVYGQQ